MIQTTFAVECPACKEELNIRAKVRELEEDKGVEIVCPECGAEIEFDYAAETGLTPTPGQEFEDEPAPDITEDDDSELDEDEDEDESDDVDDEEEDEK